MGQTGKIMYQIFLKKYKISQQQENTYKLDNNMKRCISEIFFASYMDKKSGDNPEN